MQTPFDGLPQDQYRSKFINADALKEAGYRFYPPNRPIDEHDGAFVKTVYTPEGERSYQRGIRFWDHRKYREEIPIGLDVQVYFNDPDGQIILEFSIDEDKTLAEVEVRIQRYFDALGCLHYYQRE